MVPVRFQGVVASLLYCQGSRHPNGPRYKIYRVCGVGAMITGAVVGLARPYNLSPNVIPCNIYRRDWVQKGVVVSWMGLLGEMRVLVGWQNLPIERWVLLLGWRLWRSTTGSKLSEHLVIVIELVGSQIVSAIG